MGRAPCCEKVGLKKGRWTDEEDKILTDYIQKHGEGMWRSLPKKAGLCSIYMCVNNIFHNNVFCVNLFILTVLNIYDICRFVKVWEEL